MKKIEQENFVSTKRNKKVKYGRKRSDYAAKNVAERPSFEVSMHEALVQEIPADRLGKPQEVAQLALQLWEGNEYLTGQIITLDGGWI